MSGHNISVESILSHVPATGNPFMDLQLALHAELYGGVSKSTKVAIVISLGLMGLSLVGSLTCLWARFRRGDLWLYRLIATPEGTLITPNTLVQWLVWHSVLVAISVPFAFANLHVFGILSSTPLWAGLIFLPMFFAVVHAAWGLRTAAFLTSSRVGTTTAHFVIPAWATNAFHLTFLAAAPPALLVPTAIVTVKWNKGVTVFRYLDTLLVSASQLALDAGSTPAQTVLEAVPDANELLTEMTEYLWRFQNPFPICATFSGIAFVVMAFSAWTQGNCILSQLKFLSSHGTESLPKTANSGPDAGQLRKMLVLVICTSVALCLSAAAYTVTCMLGQFVLAPSKIFQIANDQAHLFLFQFGFAFIDLIVVVCVLFQTFNKATSTRASAVSRSGRVSISVTVPSVKEESKAWSVAASDDGSIHHGLSPSLPF